MTPVDLTDFLNQAFEPVDDDTFADLLAKLDTAMAVSGAGELIEINPLP